MKKVFVIAVSLWCLFTAAAGVSATTEDSLFVIEDIVVEGLQRISPGTVFNTLPVDVGDSIDAKMVTDLIRVLFKTEFFSDIRVDRRGGVLVIAVEERASIDRITITGNKGIKTEKLLAGLEDIGFAEGLVFVPSILDRLKQELERNYYSQGKYNIRIDTTITPLPRNRVSIDIAIDEGDTSLIRRIQITGNQAFSDQELLDQMKQSETGFFNFFSSADKFSKENLSSDLETLKTYYQNRGYLDYTNRSVQVTISPDKEGVYININVEEGEQYRVTSVKLAGEMIVPPEELVELVQIRPGDVYSGQRVTQTTEAILKRLGREGYAFANVNPIPDKDENTHTVSFTYYIEPGKRAYVNKINFSGNSKTKDEVLRREMRQLEGSWFSSSDVERSKVRLDRLGFFDEVNVNTSPVPGTSDQVDIDIAVVERPSGSIAAGIGVAQDSGVILNASVSQNNFVGTGNTVSFVVNRSAFSENYSFGMTDPYFSADGMSQSFRVFQQKTESDEINITEFDTDSVGGSLSYSYPINEFDSFGYGLSFENTQITTTVFTSDEILDFVDEYGDDYDIYSLTGSWSHDTLNRRIFPDSGVLQRLSWSVTFPFSNLNYYKLNYKHQFLTPITDFYTLMLRGDLGYGDGLRDTEELPFFENYFAGGFRSVRGFRSNTLGPRASDGEALGGNLLVSGKMEVQFPPPFGNGKKSSVRLSWFFDGGNVFGEEEGFDWDELRYSTGISLIWMAPIGPLTLSLAKPLNNEPGDSTEKFQFNIGTVF